MPPDHHHSSNMALQNSKTSLRRNITINGVDINTKRSSILSNSSSSSSSSSKDHESYSPPRRRSNSNFLNRIKYFEQKTDHVETTHIEKHTPILVRKLSIKNIIDDIRAQFPEDDIEIRNGNPIKRNSKESNSPRLSYNFINTEQPIKKIENLDEVPKTKQYLNEDFSYINSECAQFFSTSNDEILLKGITVQADFRILLKGFFYDNIFYPEELASKHMRYHIHDFFDYDLSPFEYD